MSATRERLVERVEGVASRLEANAAEGERRGVLADDSIEAMRGADLLRFKLAEELGGLGADPVVETEVLEAASYADGSSGWVLGILAASSGLVGAFLPDAGAERVFGDGPTPVAGAVAPRGRAVPSDGGYRVRGRWPFGSGIHHAEWVLGGVQVEGEAPPHGLRVAVMPRSALTLHDNWQVAGLRATGSCDYSADDVFVPAEQTYSFLDMSRGVVARGGATFALGLPATVVPFHSGVALGIGRRALAEVVEQAGAKRRGAVPAPLVENPGFQEKLGRASLELEAARALVYEVLGEVWACAAGGAAPPAARQARARATSVHVTEVAARAATTAFHAMGGGALFESNPLQRCFRDAHAAAQHFLVSDSSFRAHGQFLLGAPGANPML